LSNNFYCLFPRFYARPLLTIIQITLYRSMSTLIPHSKYALPPSGRSLSISIARPYVFLCVCFRTFSPRSRITMVSVLTPLFSFPVAYVEPSHYTWYHITINGSRPLAPINHQTSLWTAPTHARISFLLPFFPTITTTVQAQGRYHTSSTDHCFLSRCFKSLLAPPHLESHIYIVVIVGGFFLL